MNVIMLDIDGVLNYFDCKARCGLYLGIEDDKVKLLKQIVDATDAKIVLSSTWRLGYDNAGHRLADHVSYMEKKLGRYGLEIYDATPHLGSRCRGKEINKWLEDHPEVENWVVLDDEWFPDYNTFGIYPHWVATYFYGFGLREDDVKIAISILEGNLIDDDA